MGVLHFAIEFGQTVVFFVLLKRWSHRQSSDEKRMALTRKIRFSIFFVLMYSFGRKSRKLNELGSLAMVVPASFLLDDTRFVLWFLMITEFDLTLKAGKLHRFIQCHRMCPINDPISTLNVEQIQLDGITLVDIGVGKEIFPSKDDGRLFIDLLLTKSFRLIQPKR